MLHKRERKVSARFGLSDFTYKCFSFTPMRSIGNATERGTFGDFARLLEHLPDYHEPTILMLLKGHLLIEELLRTYIERSVPNPRELRQRDLTFAKCLMLSRAFTAPEKESWTFDAAKQLDSVRNEIAHELTSDKLQKKLETFIGIVECHSTDSVFPPLERGEARLHMAISELYHELSNLLCRPER